MTVVSDGKPDSLLLYCRAGFEKECAAEIVRHTGLLGVNGYVKAGEASGIVEFFPFEPDETQHLRLNLRFGDLIFARQLVFVIGHFDQLPREDRLGPLMNHLRVANLRFSDVFFETADTNDAKEISGFLRKFAVPFRKSVEQLNLLGHSHLPRLHVFFRSTTSVCIGFSSPNNASPWLMGIPRLRFPRGAPSRSTLKLDEAFQVFVDDPEEALRPGMTAVDLGAAPGGWTFQLVNRHIRTIAIDNGPIDPALLESGIVQHIRADGFRYRPPKPVDWLVCDMVEQPQRIAALVADWLEHGHCQRTVFNLKLPMKKRYEMVQTCRELLETALDRGGRRYRMAFKQLYHDRAEITGYVTCLDS